MTRNSRQSEQHVTVAGPIPTDMSEAGADLVNKFFCRIIVDKALDYFKKHAQANADEFAYFQKKRPMLEAKVAVMVGQKDPQVLEEFDSVDSQAHYLDKGIVEALGQGCPESLEDGYPTDIEGVLKFAEYYKKKTRY